MKILMVLTSRNHAEPRHGVHEGRAYGSTPSLRESLIRLCTQMIPASF